MSPRHSSGAKSENLVVTWLARAHRILMQRSPGCWCKGHPDVPKFWFWQRKFLSFDSNASSGRISCLHRATCPFRHHRDTTTRETDSALGSVPQGSNIWSGKRCQEKGSDSALDPAALVEENLEWSGWGRQAQDCCSTAEADDNQLLTQFGI